MVKKVFFGQTFPDSIAFSDRFLLPFLYDLQIIKITIFYDRNIKVIKGFHTVYYSKTEQTIIEGQKNVILNEDSDKIEAKEFICNTNDFIKSIGGSMSNAGILESLTLASNMDIVYKIGNESQDCLRFSLKIASYEIPICLYGEYSNYYGYFFNFSNKI